MDYANLEKIPASLKNVEDASNLLNEKITKINNEKADANIVATSLNDLDEKVDNLTEKVDNNELAIASALTDLDDKIGYEIKTTNNITNPTKNTYYDLTSLSLTSLDLTSITLTNINEVVVKFITDSTSTCTISAPANVKFIGNSILYKGSTYILAMLYGVICICEAPSLT